MRNQDKLRPQFSPIHSLLPKLDFPLSFLTVLPSPHKQCRGLGNLGEVWSFFIYLSSSACFFHAPAWALHRPLFFQGISIWSSLGLSTSCNVNICSTVLLSLGCRGIPTPQKSEKYLLLHLFMGMAMITIFGLFFLLLFHTHLPI